MTTQSLAQQYRAEHAKTVVPSMLAAVEQVKRSSAWIARGALAVTTPHQVLFLGSLGHGGSVVDVIVSWLFALLIPAVTDLGMLTMLRITQTTGMHRQAKRRALKVLLVLVAESAIVNFIAPGHAVFRVLVAFAAIVLAAVEWVHSSVRADFDEVEAEESEVVAAPAVDQDAEARRVARNEQQRARRAAKREAELEAAEQAAAKREADRIARRARRAEVAALNATYALASAPVSGGPADDPTGEFRSYL